MVVQWGLPMISAALHWWSVAGPEVCRLLNEFIPAEFETLDRHHEQLYAAYQNMFRNDTCALKESFLELGNPFQEITEDFIAVDSRLIVIQEGVTALNALQGKGYNMYKTFVKERLVDKVQNFLNL